MLAWAVGGKADWPDLDDELDQFEASLAAEPRHFDRDELELRAAFGLKVPHG